MKLARNVSLLQGRYADMEKEGGASRLAVLLGVLVLVSLVFVGSHVFPFFYYYYEVKGLMEMQARKATMRTDEEIREVLLEKIKKLEIPINGDDDLKINRYQGKIVISLDYQEVLYVDLGEDRVYDIYVFEFSPRYEHVLR